MGVAGMPLSTSPSARLCLQDEVAHTVTESRVLQNTRHPFLTVSSTLVPGGPGLPVRPVGSQTDPLGQSSGQGPDPYHCEAQTGYWPGGWGAVLLVQGSFFIDGGFVSTPL